MIHFLEMKMAMFLKSVMKVHRKREIAFMSIFLGRLSLMFTLERTAVLMFIMQADVIDAEK